MRFYIYIIVVLGFSLLRAQDLTWNQEVITFKSANPFSFEEIITNLDNEKIQEVSGVLTLPEDFNPSMRYPLIMGVAGSLNWGPHHLKYLKMFQEMGFADLPDRLNSLLDLIIAARSFL